jgi:hypothetical protein
MKQIEVRQYSEYDKSLMAWIFEIDPRCVRVVIDATPYGVRVWGITPDDQQLDGKFISRTPFVAIA